MEFQKMFNRIAKAIEICPNYSILYTWEEDGDLISNITIPPVGALDIYHMIHSF